MCAPRARRGRGVQAAHRLMPVSDAKVPDDSVPDHHVRDGEGRADASGSPSAEELERMALPATLRRAPRLGRVLGTGIGVGALLGIVLGLSLPNSTGVGRGMVAILVGLGFALIGGLAAGAVATRLDGPDPLHSRNAKPTADEDSD